MSAEETSGSGRPVILATCRLPGEAQARLGRDYAARLRQDDAILPPSAIVEAAPGADGLLIAPTDRLSAETIAALIDGLYVRHALRAGGPDAEQARRICRDCLDSHLSGHAGALQ